MKAITAAMTGSQQTRHASHGRLKCGSSQAGLVIGKSAASIVYAKDVSRPIVTIEITMTNELKKPADHFPIEGFSSTRNGSEHDARGSCSRRPDHGLKK